MSQHAIILQAITLCLVVQEAMGSLHSVPVTPSAKQGVQLSHPKE